jgi:hypothetical protein
MRVVEKLLPECADGKNRASVANEKKILAVNHKKLSLKN